MKFYASGWLDSTIIIPCFWKLTLKGCPRPGASQVKSDKLADAIVSLSVILYIAPTSAATSYEDYDTIDRIQLKNDIMKSSYYDFQ
jgi:hypothetical protein